MEDAPLMTFKSHIGGKNADVAIYPDRIEWARAGGVSFAKASAAALTGGASLVKTGIRRGGGSEMIPVRSLSSVTTNKDGLRFYKVTLITTGNTIDFRVDKGTAEQVKELVTRLMLGTHASQQSGESPSPPTSPVTGASVADELARLAELRDAGVLSAEEFDGQKARLLSR